MTNEASRDFIQIRSHDGSIRSIRINPMFKRGDVVEDPMGFHQVVAECDLHGCTVDNGTPRGARYSPERLKLISRKGDK